jgi:hypothetical protein
MKNPNKRTRGDEVKCIPKCEHIQRRIKRWYDKRLKKKEFKEGDKGSSSTVRGLKSSERGNCKASGTDLTLFIRCSPMER